MIHPWAPSQSSGNTLHILVTKHWSVEYEHTIPCHKARVIFRCFSPHYVVTHLYDEHYKIISLLYFLNTFLNVWHCKSMGSYLAFKGTIFHAHSMLLTRLPRSISISSLYNNFMLIDHFAFLNSTFANNSFYDQWFTHFLDPPSMELNLYLAFFLLI